ncbi:MAG: periplasmic heavy metal sensor [Opitutus sp.]
MKRTILFLSAIALVAAVACLFTLRWSQRRAAADDFLSHDWLHHELNLTPAQVKSLEPIEARFAGRQRVLAAEMADANRQLARAMAEEKAFTPRVAGAVEHVHHCMGDLQKASIEHVFAMRTVLSPEQGDKLLDLAQKVLEQAP